MKKYIFSFILLSLSFILFSRELTAGYYVAEQGGEGSISYLYLNEVSNHFEGNYYSMVKHSFHPFMGHGEKRVIVSDDNADSEIRSIKIHALNSGLTLHLSDGNTQKLRKSPQSKVIPYLYKENVVLDTSLEKSPVMSCSIMGIQFADDTLNNTIARYFYQSRAGLPESARNLFESWKIDYLAMGIDLMQDQLSAGYGIPATLNWQYNDKVEEVFHSERLVCLRRSHYEYTGGAHGNYFQEYMIWDQEACRQVKLQDLFKTGSQKAIKKLLTENILEKYKVDDPLEILFEKDFPISEDICITPEGICFQYDPYDIACYAAGSIELCLDYNDLMPYVTKYYISIK